MKTYKLILGGSLLAAFLLLGSATAWAQNVPPPEAVAIGLDPSELPAGFQMESREVSVGNYETGFFISGLNQTLIREKSTAGERVLVDIIYAVAPTREQVPEVLEAFLVEAQLPWRVRQTDLSPAEGPHIGDVTYGRNPIDTLFVQDRAFVAIYAEPNVPFDELEVIVNDLVAKIQVRIESQGMTANPLQVRAQLLSDRIDLGAGTVAELTAQANVPAEYFANIAGEGVPLGTPFLKAELQEGPFHFGWDGSLTSGEFVPPGDYEIVLTVTSRLGAEKTSLFTVHVVQNQSSNRVLSPTKDTILRSNKPHANEGANPTLVLDKSDQRQERERLGSLDAHTASLFTVGGC